LIAFVLTLVTYETVYISAYGSSLPPNLSQAFKTNPAITLYLYP
jgi:hypothetical protein